MENEPTVRIKFLQEYEELFNPDWRTLVYYGGRGSGKSQHVALALILRGRDTKLRILCTRELQNTIADSVHKLLSDIINKNGFTDYEITEKSIRNKLSGTEFIFKGLRHNSTEIKSTEGIDIAWVEEAQSISEDSLKLLVPTIRKPGSQLIFTFNRMYELDPVYVRYVLNERPRTYVRKVNYDVLCNAGLLPDELYEEMLADKAVSYGLYAHVWLGEPVSQADNAIIGRESIMKAMEREIDPVGSIEVGVDVARMGNDRTVFMKRKGMKKIDEKIYSKLRTDEVADMLEEFVEFDRSVIIKIDDSGVGCLTPDTEVLTPSGWKRADGLKPGDSLYSRDEAGKVSIESVFSNRTKETEILETGGYKFSWSHLIPYRTRLSNKEQLGTWQDVLSRKQVIFESDFRYETEKEDFVLPGHTVEMPNGGVRTFHEPLQVDANTFAEFLGWYISEGSFEEPGSQIKITQHVNDHFVRILELAATFGTVSLKPNGEGYDIRITNKPLLEWIKGNCYRGGFGFKYKAIPRFIANNSREVIDSFLDAFRKGDGHMHKGSRYYSTSSVNLVGDLTELIYKIGKKAGSYLHNEKGSKSVIEGRTITRSEDGYTVFECKENKSGYHYGLVPKDVTVTRGTVHSLIITGSSRLMFTRVPGKKPFWTHNGGVTDQMMRRGYRVVPINFGQSANDPDRYPNMISEGWFYLASIMDEMDIELDNDLLMELSTRQWKMDSKGRRVVESKGEYKKRGFRSPDKADALILCYYNVVPGEFEERDDSDDDFEPITSGLLSSRF